MNSLILSLSAITLYVASTAVLAIRFVRAPDDAVARRSAIWIGLLAVALHGLTLYSEVITSAGLNLGFFHAASLVAFMVALIILLSSVSQPVENLALVFLPIAAIAMGLELGFTSARLIPADASWQLQVHIVFSILAYSLLAIAAAQAVLLAWQEHGLRTRHPGGYLRALPPLQTMESLLFQMISTGFALLSAALLTGFLFLTDMFAQHLAHKTVLSLVAWVIFGILLWGRLRSGWRGRTAIRWTLGGFIALMFAYFGSKLVLEVLLQRTA